MHDNQCNICYQITTLEAKDSLFADLASVENLRKRINETDFHQKLAFYRFRVEMYEKHRLDLKQNHLLFKALYGTDPFKFKDMILIKFLYTAGTILVSLNLHFVLTIFSFTAISASVFAVYKYHPTIFDNYYVSTTIEFAYYTIPALSGIASFLPGLPYAFDCLASRNTNHYIGATSTIAQFVALGYYVRMLSLRQLISTFLDTTFRIFCSSLDKWSDAIVDDFYKKDLEQIDRLSQAENSRLYGHNIQLNENNNKLQADLSKADIICKKYRKDLQKEKKKVEKKEEELKNFKLDHNLTMLNRLIKQLNEDNKRLRDNVNSLQNHLTNIKNEYREFREEYFNLQDAHNYLVYRWSYVLNYLGENLTNSQQQSNQ